MKKYFLLLAAVLTSIAASADGDNRFTVSAGFQFPSTLNAQIGFEHDLSYGNAIEVFGEMGNHWQHPVCHMFWKGYYWDGGVNYKHRLVRFKNGQLRVRGGVDAGADRRKFFFGAEVGFEYDYIFANGWRFCVIQKNNFNFLHGDTFRNGLLLGIKIPI